MSKCRLPGRLLGAALMALSLAAPAAAQGPDHPSQAFRKQPKQTWNKRGVYFFDGPTRSLLAGLGKRGDYSTNRIALDDDHTTATWDPHARKIVIRNTREYEDETDIACVLLLGTGKTAAGAEVPVGVHLNISKEDDEFEASIHAHVSVREGIPQAQFLSAQVILDDGESRQVVMTKTDGLRSLRSPFADSTLATIVGLKGVDNLEGKPVDVTLPGARIADGSVGLGRSFLSKLVLRAQMISLDGTRRVPPGTPWSHVMQQGGWELRLTALSSLLPKDPWERNIFLLGLEDVPILKPLAENGLEDEQTLAFTFRAGQGTVSLGEDSHPVDDPAEAVRRYLEFDFIGGIVTHQMQLRLTGEQDAPAK